MGGVQGGRTRPKPKPIPKPNPTPKPKPNPRPNRDKAAIPEEEHAGGFIAAYGRRLRGELGQEAQLAAAKAWSVWEGSVSRLKVH